jgi:hypothetical protein
VKRIHVYYEGVRYTIADRELTEVKNEIEGALADGSPHWLQVNHGEGTLRKTELLIAPGIGIGVMPIDADSEDQLPPAHVVLPGGG